MKTTNPVRACPRAAHSADPWAARLALLLVELRLTAVKLVWADLAA